MESLEPELLHAGGAPAATPSSVALRRFATLASYCGRIVANYLNVATSLSWANSAPTALAAKGGTAVSNHRGIPTSPAVSFCGISTGATARRTIVALNIGAAARSTLAAFALLHPLLQPLDDDMTNKSQPVHGLPLEEWAAIYRAGMPEFAATRFAYTFDAGLVRIAFGVEGPYSSAEGGRSPVYTHAVTVPPGLAVEVARLLLKALAQPVEAASKPRGEA